MIPRDLRSLRSLRSPRGSRSRTLIVAAALLAAIALVGCGDDGGADGWTSVATGDIYGEWELLAEYDDGEWTGCLRIDYDPAAECADPASDRLVTFESSDSVTFGAVPQGAELEFADGDEVRLIDGRFFVVASDAAVQLAG